MPKVSVIVPVYGVEKYIERCARSLFEQTLDDIEYIFINDCTPDDSIKVLMEVLDDYPHRKGQVRIQQMLRNSGQAAVRKWGMEHSTGDYIIHCDPDDWVDKSMYKKLWRTAVEGGYDMVRCDFVRTDGKKNVHCRIIPETAYNDNYKLISYVLIGSSLTSLCDKLVKRSIITDNSIVYPECDMQEDAVLVVQMLYYSNKIKHIPETFYYYYANSGSITHTSTEESYLKNLNDVCSNTRLILEFLDQKGICQMYKEEIICRKYNDRSHLISLISDKKFKNMWWTIYPEIDGKILLNRKMNIKEKLEYYCVKFGLYNIIHRS